MDNINKNKLLKIISLSIFTLGIIIGTGILITGLVKTNGIKNENKQIVRKIENKYESVTSKEAQEKMVSYIKETENKITNLESEISSLESEKTQIFMKEGFSTNYYQKDNEIKNKRNEKSTLKNNARYYNRILTNIKSGEYDKQMKNEIKDEKKDESQYHYLYYIGLIVLLVSCLISFIILLILKLKK